MDRKSISYIVIGLFFLGAVLFRDSLSSAISTFRNSDGGPRASLQRPPRVSGESPIERVLGKLQGNTVETTTKVAVRSIGTVENANETVNMEQVSPRRAIGMSVEKASANKRTGTIRVRGVAFGDGIERIEVYRNNQYLFDILKGKARPKKTPFSFRYAEGTGIYKIRLVADDGSYFDRWYRFLPWIGGPIETRSFHAKAVRPRIGNDWIPF